MTLRAILAVTFILIAGSALAAPPVARPVPAVRTAPGAVPAAQMVFYVVKGAPGVEINKLFRLVRDDVMEATAGRQEPYTYGSLPGREDFFFVNR